MEREPSSSGTCFAVRPDGLIMTAYHVVMNAKEISVQLSDRRIYPALVESVSSLADLALLRIEASNLDFLSLAPIRSSSVGDHVFTLGFPAPSLLGLEPRFTDGSISALSGPGARLAFSRCPSLYTPVIRVAR